MKKLLLTTLFLIGCGGSSSEKEIEIIEPEIKTNKLCVIFNNPAKDAFNDMSVIVYPENMDSIDIKYNKKYQQHANLMELDLDTNAYIDGVLGWTTEIQYLEINIVNGDHITFVTLYPSIDYDRNQRFDYSIIESTSKKCQSKPF